MGTNFTDIAPTDPVVAATINDRLDELDAAIVAGSGAGVDVPLDNIFINGGFDVWQRTDYDHYVSGDRKYVADRWAVMTETEAEFGVAASDTVRSGARSALSLQLVGATGVTAVNIDQRIESRARGQYKQELFFSAYVYNGSGTAFTPKLFVSTPSAEDDWTSSTVRNGSGENLESCSMGAWTRVTWTADISGYTNIDNGVEFRLRIPSGALGNGDTVYLAEMNLVPGGVATPFLPRPVGMEIGLCERYCQFVTGSGHAASSSVADIHIALKPVMRATPTVSAQAPVSVWDGTVGVITQSAASVSIINGGSARGFIGRLSNFSGLTNNRAYEQLSTTPILCEAEL